MNDIKEELSITLARQAEMVPVEENLEAILTGTNPVRLSSIGDRRQRRTWPLTAAAAAVVLAGAAGLVWVDQSDTESPAASDATQPVEGSPDGSTYQQVLDLLPGDDWVAVAVSPDGQQLSAFDAAGRRAWFSYVESPDSIAPTDLDDDGTGIAKDETVGDGVAFNCFLDTVDRLFCNTTEQGLPALDDTQIETAASELLPLLREGNQGPLAELIDRSAASVDKVVLEDSLARSLGDDSVWLTIDPGVVTTLEVGTPLQLSAPDGSTVTSVVDSSGLLYRIRTGPAVNAADVLQAIPTLLEVSANAEPTPVTTLPPQQS
jgi:hypothetical protein